MTKEEIIEMARKSDFEIHPDNLISFDGIDCTSELIAFAKLIAEKAIKEALAQPEQEPVAWEQFYPDIGKPKFVAKPEHEPVAWTEKQFFDDGTPHPCSALKWAGRNEQDDFPVGTKFYTTTPQRKPLTDEEIAVERALDNLLYWTERAVNKGNANLDIEEAMQQYNDALAAAHDIKE